ncbi:NACHT, LRR and PYD domains-containing protein 12-like isoform X2 [Callorhinchus milii]|uniref:NACHT, LRR and PYD domains-containing protein 12-like isoform X2 n=1 Tax=Callorhinchus milii TaxID=7868 RepID=UPI001C3F8CE1|nr:NACHT, LRR and PYD domains-containing protein 12-like isoform X2 [Callorhinchus milii]
MKWSRSPQQNKPTSGGNDTASTSGVAQLHCNMVANLNHCFTTLCGSSEIASLGTDSIVNAEGDAMICGMDQTPVKTPTGNVFALPDFEESLKEMITDKGSNTLFTETLALYNGYQLHRLTNFYRDRLEQAIEEGVEDISSRLTQNECLSPQEHKKLTELTHSGRKRQSSKLLLNMVMGKGSQSNIVMWESFVKMRQTLPKPNKIMTEIQEQGASLVNEVTMDRSIPDFPSDMIAIQGLHKDTLHKQCEKLEVKTILIQEKGSGSDSPTGTSAVVSGVAGIGKTTMVQKIVHDWATGKIYPQFHFVFVFKFRDLNKLHNKITLNRLIVEQYPYLRDVLEELWKLPERLLFILDGLDEFGARINFADSRRDTEPQRRCTDPKFCCKVCGIVYSLIQKKLLPGCSVLVTSRPTALYLLAKAQVSVWAEILGFVGQERKEYFQTFFEDQEVAAAVYSHVEENELLLTMCYNPSYCWILALSLGPFFIQKHSNKQQVPKTITQLFYYIYHILTLHSVKMESSRNVMLKIGEMAFTGVSQRNIVFNDEDLIKYNLQPSQFLSGFLMELVERESSENSVVYTFPHLTIQEFVAALAQFLFPNPEGIRDYFYQAHSKEDGRFEIFLRFVAGLSSPRAAQPLEEFLGPFVHQKTYAVIDWLKEKIKAQVRDTDTVTGKRKLRNLLHYLF